MARVNATIDDANRDTFISVKSHIPNRSNSTCLSRDIHISYHRRWLFHYDHSRAHKVWQQRDIRLWNAPSPSMGNGLINVCDFTSDSQEIINLLLCNLRGKSELHIDCFDNGRLKWQRCCLSWWPDTQFKLVLNTVPILVIRIGLRYQWWYVRWWGWN